VRRRKEERINTHKQELKDLFKAFMENRERKKNEKFIKQQTSQKIKQEMNESLKLLKELKEKQTKEEASYSKERKKVTI
jgi:hypothetical protein